MTDTSLKEQIDELESHVQDCVGNRVRDVRIVRYKNGIVLRGFAHTYYGKQLAQHAVMQATDLPLVANEIEVK